MIKAISLINGLKSSRLYVSIKRNPSSEAILTSIQILNVGMPSLRLTRKKPIINYVSPGKLKLTSGPPNRQKSNEKSALKWKKKDSSSTPEQIKWSDPVTTSTRKCGCNVETKLHYTYKD